jgi:Tol biopolymer transport system component
VSLATSGAEADADANSGDISGDGRLVAFWSAATNLVPADTNGVSDIFLFDRATQALTRIGLAPGGVEPNGWSFLARISGDGSTVVFTSIASNLFPPDVNNQFDVFAVDVATGAVHGLTLVAGSLQANDSSGFCSVSGDGRYVAFDSWASNLAFPAGTAGEDVFVHDRATAQTRLVSTPIQGGPANGPSTRPEISADGRWIVFETTANDLAGSEATHLGDVVRADRVTGEVVLLSTNPFGGETSDFSRRPAVSGDGQIAVFESYAYDIDPTDLNGVGDVFAHDLAHTPPQSYCVGKPHSGGCTAAIGFQGTPSTSSPSAFRIDAGDVRHGSFGVLFYSRQVLATPFQGGTLCAAPPLQRTATQNAGGASACSGAFTFDFNAWLRGGGDPSVVPGTTVYAQYWFRDPQNPSPFKVAFSDALRFVMQP